MQVRQLTYLLVWVALLLPAMALADGGTVLETTGPVFRFNRGELENVTPGQRWLVFHQGQKVGEAVVESVSEYSATARLPDGTAVYPGDLVTLTAPPAYSSATASPTLASAIKPDREDLKRVRERYHRAFTENTHTRDFVTPHPHPSTAMSTVNTGAQLYTMYQFYDAATAFDPTGASLVNPFWLASMAAPPVIHQFQTNDPWEPQRTRLQVSVTYWDEYLVDRCAEYLAAREGMNLDETLMLKQRLVTERQVDRYAVFEVRVRNTGVKEAPLKPFKWHMYMMNADNRPLAPSRYDPALDSLLQPGQEVSGLVLYPKLAVAGQDTLSIAIEQMFGDRGTLEFQVR
ncbi:MAG: hypothetical protein AB7S38_04355 [Vulcanimicrobiota bacterium]